MIHAIEALLAQKGENQSAIFVFPSDIAASLWLERLLSVANLPTIATNRCIAWDRFKEEVVKANVLEKSPVSSLIRKLYARDLSKRNSIKPFFQKLIPIEHSENSEIFANWLSRILPQLDLWERKKQKAGSDSSVKTAEKAAIHAYCIDEEEKDIEYLKEDYTKFLELHHLFEPSWQRAPVIEDGKQYYIIFPETIEDWSEFAPVIESSSCIHRLSIADIQLSENDLLAVEYDTIREEFTATAVAIEDLLQKGEDPSQIAISIANLADVEPYVTRELELRGIPIEYRSGFPLTTKPAGRLFPLISSCTQTNFSFASVKALLLDRVVPWKDADLAQRLVDFGISNRCVTSWTEEGKTIDVWKESFKNPTSHSKSDEVLFSWYTALRSALERITQAKDFTSIRIQWFMFRNRFLDMSLLREEDDAVLARCIEELNNLISIETEYKELIPEKSWDFFVGVLSETNYVAQRKHKGGVSIFPYRVAAATPFKHHFVLDTSQDSTTILYRQLSFLRNDKREALFALETDASHAFMAAYKSCNAHFSFSKRTFKGYTTVLSCAIPSPKRSAILSDPFRDEREGEPDRLYPIQHKGYLAEKSRMTRFSSSILTHPLAISPFTGKPIRVSQTDLDLFSVCNTRWYFSQILKIQEEKPDAELFNERYLGSLYHAILKKVYDTIRLKEPHFQAANLQLYKEWLIEETQEAAKGFQEFRSPILQPIVSALRSRIVDRLFALMEKDGELLNGCKPVLLEEKISLIKGDLEYYGIIDRISVRQSDCASILIDYKSNMTPTPSSYKTGDAENPQMICDFQIPMYLYVAENADTSPFKGKTIDHAWFASIDKATFIPIIDEDDGICVPGKRNVVDRSSFNEAMDAFHQMVERFENAVKTSDFTRPKDLVSDECAKCTYTKICRYTYAVRKR